MSEEKKEKKEKATKKEEKKQEEVKEEKVENKEEETNNIQISDDVVAVIAGMAASEVPGVAEMAGGFAGGISEVLSGRKNKAKGIKVDIEDKKVKIDVNIIVEYGSRIPDVAFEIQKRVKKSVENMTGLVASEINVHVQGVVTVEEENANKEKEDKEESKEDKKEEVKPEDKE